LQWPAAILLAVALIVAATIFRLRQPSIIDIYLESSAWLITSLTLAVVVGRAVFARGKINYHRVIGGVLLYLNIGMFFVALYVFAALLVHNAFTGLGPLEDNLTVAGNLIYFSFVTLTSVGYGDIVPLHPVVRGISNVEAIIGQLYPATLLARLCDRMRRRNVRLWHKADITHAPKITRTPGREPPAVSPLLRHALERRVGRQRHPGVA
jgi:hypothetical protein